MKGRTRGFSLLEISIGLVVMGVIASVGLPTANLYANHFKNTKDKVNMRQLNKLIVGYAMTRGGFPDAAAGDVLPSTNIGMTGINPYNQDVNYYVNALLTETATTQDFTTLCDEARNILDGTTASTTPAICNDVTLDFTDCTDSTVMAFVIVSSGKNLALEHENGDGDSDYENPTKKQHKTDDYDDVVSSYGLPALVSECQNI